MVDFALLGSRPGQHTDATTSASPGAKTSIDLRSAAAGSAQVSHDDRRVLSEPRPACSISIGARSHELQSVASSDEEISVAPWASLSFRQRPRPHTVSHSDCHAMCYLLLGE